MKDRAGSPALEFALVAPLFFAAIFGTFELGRGLYERSRFGAAAAIAMRAVALNPAAGETEIKNAIRAALSDYDVDKLKIDLADESYSGQTFKKIEVSSDFNFLVNFGHNFGGFTLTATRYAPVMSSKSS